VTERTDKNEEGSQIDYLKCEQEKPGPQSGHGILRDTSQFIVAASFPKVTQDYSSSQRDAATQEHSDRDRDDGVNARRRMG
jgi:hypothetical protein